MADASVRKVTPVLGSPPPVDKDNNTSLVRAIDCTDASKPVLPTDEMDSLTSLLAEQRSSEKLLLAGLAPRATILLTGAPGVGKTMLAKWIAAELGLPLYQAELSSTISSYLGQTGQNIKELIDFQHINRVVLLLDEFDAIAKRRDDESELGELKRIVNVLLKELEDWHGPSLIIGATDPPALLDPAVHRRFHMTLSLALPNESRSMQILSLHLKPESLSEDLLTFAGILLAGHSGSAIRDIALNVRRDVCLNQETVENALLLKLAANTKTIEQRKLFCQMAAKVLPPKQKKERSGHLAKLLNVSKSTVHAYTAKGDVKP